MVRVILKRGKEQSLKRFHPWVFSGAIDRVVCPNKEKADSLKEGEVVEVYSKEGEFLGVGHFQVGTIAVRILSFNNLPIDSNFWFNALQEAYNMRCSLGLIGSAETNAYRLVHGEGDFLPGLIVDIYNNVAVIQAHSAGIFLAREEIATALQRLYGGSLVAIYDKSESTAPFKAGLDLKDGYLYRDANFKEAKDVILENGNKFYVNWEEGQKTGFFLDQRDNRNLVKNYSFKKDVLNLFCYTGGFSVYALNGGANFVDSVDCSKRAVELVAENVELNGYKEGVEHNSICKDAIDYLREVPNGKYNLMIVDPPAFAKHRGSLDNALRGYKKLNALAIEKVAKGGIIFTYSCSQVVDKQAFALTIFSAAAIVGRKVRILHRLTQPADHPVNIYHPEGEYLKGLVLQVE